MQLDSSLWPRQFKGIDQDKLQSKVTSYLTDIVRDISFNDGNFIVSNEGFFRSDEDAIGNCIDWFSEFFDDIEVLAFIRNPVDQYSSSQQQVIKANHYLESPDKFHYDFRKVVENWRKLCSVSVIQFNKGSDSLALLSEHIGIETHSMLTPERSNESLSIEQMLLLEKIQSHLYSDYPNTFKNHLSLINGFKKGQHTSPKLKEEAIYSVINNHFEDLQWLKQFYGIDFGLNTPQRPFDEYFPEECKISDVYSIDASSYAVYESLIIDALLRDRAKKNN